MIDRPLVRLDSLYNIARGGSPRPIKKYLTDDPDGVSWVKIGDATASGKYIYETKEKITRDGIKRSRLVKKGDFILSNSMSFGRPYIMGVEGCIHDGWLVLSPKDDSIDQDFLYHLLGSPFVFQQFDDLAAGSTVRNLNIGLVSGVQIPLLPLEEQKRIVGILDEAFAGIDQAIANTEKNLQNARDLLESYLNNIFTKKGEGWEDRKLGELGKITSSKRIYKNEYKESGVPFYRTKEIKELANGKELTIELFIANDRYQEIYDKFGVPIAGDILMTAIGTIGEIYVVKENDKFYFKDGNVLWLKEFNDVEPNFLKFALRSFVAELQRMSHGSTYNALPIEKLKNHVLFVPKKTEQLNIVKNLIHLQGNVRSLEVIHEQKLAALKELKQSLLQKAFAGELTADMQEAA